MENAVLSKRNEFIKVPPSRELLTEYFDVLHENGSLYLVFLQAAGKTALCYEMDENQVFTYRAFIDRDEAEFYANYVAHKNKFPPSSVKTSSMGYQELIQFMDDLRTKNVGKFMKMSTCTMISNKMTIIDTLWTNYQNYMV
jgi:hypothetical protein